MNQEKNLENTREIRDKVASRAEKIMIFATTAQTVNVLAMLFIYGNVISIDRLNPVVLFIAIPYLVVSIVTFIICFVYYKKLKKLGVAGYNYVLGTGISMVVFAVIIFPLNLVMLGLGIAALMKLYGAKAEDRYMEILRQRKKDAVDAAKEGVLSNDEKSL